MYPTRVIGHPFNKQYVKKRNGFMNVLAHDQKNEKINDVIWLILIKLRNPVPYTQASSVIGFSLATSAVNSGPPTKPKKSEAKLGCQTNCHCKRW